MQDLFYHIASNSAGVSGLVSFNKDMESITMEIALPLILVFLPFLALAFMVLFSGAAPAAPASPAKSLYEKLGGEPAVNAAVDIFYRKVLKDDRIKHFFATTDMARQAAKQKAFLTMAFGGPNNYSGEDMRKGHAHLVAKGLNDSHFDAVMEHLGATLKELNVPGDLIAQCAAIAESTRKDVLYRDPAAPKSLYEKLGGEPAVNAAVDIFYRKVLKDDRINRFFANTDMTRQAAKQKAFLTMAFGGPNNYSGEDMRKGHAHLVTQGLNDSHFDAVMEHLGATLAELNVPGDLIAQCAAVAESTRKDILGK
jgi:hemoglobin